MNLPESYTFGDTLDAIFLSLLENLKEIHDYNIVHRDREPFFSFLSYGAHFYLTTTSSVSIAFSKTR